MTDWDGSITLDTPCAHCRHPLGEHFLETPRHPNPMQAKSCYADDDPWGSSGKCQCKGWAQEVLERQHAHVIQTPTVLTMSNTQAVQDSGFTPIKVDPVPFEEYVVCALCGAPGHPQVAKHVRSGWRLGVQGVHEGAIYCPACVPGVLLSIPEPHNPAPLVDDWDNKR